jgi:flagellar hook-associated protein 1 FlgK
VQITAAAVGATPAQYSVLRLSDNTLTAGSPGEVDGVQFKLTQSPLTGDTFMVRPTAGGASAASGIQVKISDPAKIALGKSSASGDNTNALALSSLQSAITTNGNASFQGAYSQLVNQVGNKTRELEVTSAAAGQLHTSAVTAQQSESGVNLDEEAANLLKYQQAYQAAGKLMKTASDMFDVLLSLGA